MLNSVSKLKLMNFLLMGVVILFVWGCPAPPPAEEETFPLSSAQFAFLQESNQLYFAVEAAPSFQGNRLQAVQVAWYGTESSAIPDTLTLNDAGLDGDIIAADGLYARKVLNDTSQVTNLIAMSDTGRVFVEYLGWYGNTEKTVLDSFYLGNIRPLIVNVSAPDTVQRPATGFELVLITGEVFDANGLNDIRWVGFRSYHTGLDSFMNNGDYIYLYDDGGEEVLLQPNITSGDLVRGDGIYSFQAPLVSSSTPGTYHWIFEAQDWHNAYSDTVIHRIVVQ
jgi:hypothetical protein